MIVRKVQVENWVVFRSPFEADFADGINIVSGLNEVGKTTMVDAIRICLFEKHTARSHKIESLVPWGTTLSPYVIVTFNTKDEDYRIEKRFLMSPSSRLEKRVDDKWVRMAEGDVADYQTAQLAGGEVSSRGASRPEHWGLGQVLWTKQGDTMPARLNQETLDKLQGIVSSVVTSHEEGRLFDILWSKFDQVLTTKRREPKAGSPLHSLIGEIQRLEDRKGDLNNKWAEKEQLERNVEDFQMQLAKEREELQAADKEFEEATSEDEQAKTHETERKKIDADVNALQRKWDGLHEKVERIRKLKVEIEEREEQSRTAGTRLEILEGERDEIAEKLVTNKKELEEIQKDIELLSESLKHVRIAHDTIEKERRELVGFEGRFQKAEKLERYVKDLQKNLEDLSAPSREELDRVRRMHFELAEKEVELRSIGLRVILKAVDEISGELYLDGKKMELRTPQGAQEEWEAAQHIKMVVGNFGELDITSGSQDVRELQSEVEQLRENFKKATAQYGTVEIGSLEKLAERRDRLERDIQTTEQTVSELAPEGMEELRKQITRLRQSIKDDWQKIPDYSPFKKFEVEKDKESARAETVSLMEKLEDDVGHLQKQMRETGQEQNGIAEDLEGKKNEIQETRNAIEHLTGEQERSREYLEELEQDGLSTKERESELKEAAVELERKKLLLERYVEEKEGKEEKPARRYKKAEGRLEEVKERISRIEKELAVEEGRLDHLLQAGIYTEASRIEEELESLHKRKKGLETEVYAINLLCNLVEFYGRQILESVTEPIRARLTEDFRRVVGPKYSVIELDDGIMPSFVRPANWDSSAEVDVLSYGTQEQLGFLVRLALGQVLAADESQLVIFDDPLTNTDDIRLAHCLQILEEAARKLQVIILTCHPEKYTALESANTVPVGQY